MTASILIVDDQLELLAFTGSFLAECGYTVSWAPNAADALRILESNRPVDILLTDIRVYLLAVFRLGQGVQILGAGDAAQAVRPGLRQPGRAPQAVAPLVQ